MNERTTALPLNTRHRGRVMPGEPRSIPCHQCGDRLPLDVAEVVRHVNENHPVIVKPGVARHAAALPPVAPDPGVETLRQAIEDTRGGWCAEIGIADSGRIAAALYRRLQEGSAE